MNHTEDQFPTPLAPHYSTSSVSSEVVLYEGEIEIRFERMSVSSSVRIYLRWAPSARIEFHCPSYQQLVPLGDCRFAIRNGTEVRQASIVATGSGGLTGFVHIWEPIVRTTPEPAAGVVELRSHIVNLDRTPGAFLRVSNGAYAGRHELRFKTWRITLDDLNHEVSKSTRSSGGFGVTHILSCVRAGGIEFSPVEAESVGHVSSTALSFCSGHAVGVVLPVGFSSTGSLVYDSWGMTLSAPMGNGGWFPFPFSDTELVPYLDAFLASSGEETIRRALNLIVHWYLEANRTNGSVNHGIVNAMTALEIAAWVILCLKGSMAPRDFKKASAHVKIRAALENAQVNHTALMLDLPDLREFTSSEHACEDGIESLSRIRNRTVHPSAENEAAVHVLEQGWRYALHLVERLTFAIIGFKGVVRVRTSPGWPFFDLESGESLSALSRRRR